MKKIFFTLLIMNIIINMWALNMNLDIGDEENTLNIDKYLEYLKQRNLETDKIREEEIKFKTLESIVRNEFQNIIYDYLSNKVYLEFHLGLSTMYHFERNYTTYCNLAIKYNIFNPKRIGNPKIFSSILALEEILDAHNIELSAKNQKKIDEIKDELTEYDRSLFKRISIGLSIPFYPEVTNGPLYDDAYMEKNNIIELGYNYFYIADIALFVSIDFTDYITIQLGYDIIDFNSFYIGITTDFSTPISGLLGKFLYYIEDLIYH